MFMKDNYNCYIVLFFCQRFNVKDEVIWEKLNSYFNISWGM